MDPASYAARLQPRRWKELLHVQAPYRWNLRRLRLGRTLDVGCGTGRNLRWLAPGSVGVDTNSSCVAAARAAGLPASLPGELATGRFDSLLFSHVLEHVSDPAALVRAYVGRADRLVFITPQEAGFRSDPTHMTFVDFDVLASVVGEVGGTVVQQYSFPFPRSAGRWFRYNEFVVVAHL